MRYEYKGIFHHSGIGQTFKCNVCTRYVIYSTWYHHVYTDNGVQIMICTHCSPLGAVLRSHVDSVDQLMYTVNERMTLVIDLYNNTFSDAMPLANFLKLVKAGAIGI